MPVERFDLILLNTKTINNQETNRNSPDKTLLTEFLSIMELEIIKKNQLQ